MQVPATEASNPDKYLIVVLLAVMVFFVLRTLIKFQQGVTVEDGGANVSADEADDEGEEEEEKED